MEARPIRRALALALLGFAGAVAALWMLQRVDGSASPHAQNAALTDQPASRSADEVGAAAALPEAERSAPAADVARRAEPTAEQTHAGLLSRRLEERSLELELQNLAKSRFDQALGESGLTADDVPARVREVMRGMELSAVLDADGMLEGLRIDWLAPDGPMAALGFRPGDRIERIDGVKLHDPADLPALLASLKRWVRFCALRDRLEICGDVALDSSE